MMHKTAKAQYFHCLILALILLSAGACSTKTDIGIHVSESDPRIEFAVSDIRNSSDGAGGADIRIEVNPDAEGLQPQGFEISRTGKEILITGADAAGAMYGGLELAEQIRLYGFKGIREMKRNPYMEMRGTKFNIPLGMHAPTYTERCASAQNNIPEMWNMDFWKEYIDNLARYRYNYISLWSLHPFATLVKVPEYLDVAYDNVYRSTIQWDEYNNLTGHFLDTPEILENYELIKEISIDEKIEFWKEVMAYGKSRNVDFYFVTWNIFTYGTGGKYGITDEMDNEVTRDYFRRSVKQMFVSYPDLAGIGLTTGENMHHASFEEKEDWAFDAYARGMMDAAREMPERQFRFIHRQHQTGADLIAEKFKPLISMDNVDFIFSFKYAKAHVYSATTQPYHEEFVKKMAAQKTIWTLRNDDIYYFRWGAPDFVREFISNIPYDVSQGYYYGSDGHVWGREFLMKEPETPRQIEIVKHWYHWMLWGRLGYDPGLSNERLTELLQYKYPEVDAGVLFTAWQDASMIYPITTGLHWGALDFQWYIEGCKSLPRVSKNETGFHDVNHFIRLSTHPSSGYQSIEDYVEMQASGGISELKSPFEVAQMLHRQSDAALLKLENMSPGSNRELGHILNDIKTMALLGRYYGFKISGSANLALYRDSREAKYKKEALEQLDLALGAWNAYTETALKQNINPLWTARVGNVDWKQIAEWVAMDIDIVRAEK